MSRASRAREEERRIRAAAASGRPRNPTGYERSMGEPPLGPLEWEALMTWQIAQIASLTTYETIARRTLVETELARGNVPDGPGSTVFSPGVPQDTPPPYDPQS